MEGKNILLRLSEADHQKIKEASEIEHRSLNNFCVKVLVEVAENIIEGKK